MNNDIKKAREEVFYYYNGTAGGFATALLDLMGKADSSNKARLGLGFPFVAQALRECNSCKDNQEFYNKFIKGETRWTN